MQDLPLEKRENLEKGGEKLARLFKYNRQYTIDCITKILPIDRIQCKTEYSENKRYYDKLSEITEKYKIDSEKYISFCVRRIGLTEIRKLLDITYIKAYVTELKISKQLEDVHEDFIKTANGIADICIENNISPSAYISDLITNNTLAYEYYNGNISKYYLAGIQNFKELYTKLDYVNREELSIIYEATDQLKDTLRESFMKYDEEIIMPISYTEGIIKTKQQNKITN